MKKFKIAISVIFLISFCSFNVFATEEKDVNSLISDYSEQLFGSLDNNTQKLLSDFGLDSLEAGSFINLSLKDIALVMKNAFSMTMKEYISSFSEMLGLLIVMIIINSIREKSESELLDDVFYIICVLIISVLLTDIITVFAAVFTLTDKFMMALIPIMTVMLSFGGSVTFSAAYSSMMIAFCQLIAFFSENIIVPFSGIYFGLIISMNFNEATNSRQISKSVNSISVSALSVISTAFTLMLSAKNILAKDIDGVLFKSGKYLISSFVPVVGGAVSSVLNSVIGSLSLVKNTIGVFAIIAALLINLPLFIKISLCRFLLGIISFIGDSFGDKKTSELVMSISEGFKLLSVLAFFEMITVIISTGLAVSVRSSLQ